MSKSIFIVDTPNYCSQCELCMEDKYADYQCVALLETVNVYKKEKLKDCPLKQMPHKDKPTNTPLEDEILYAQGWNDCIDELLGEEK